jgi:hypothetical protein
MEMKSAFWLFFSVSVALLPGCASDYRITTAGGDYDEVKHIWEYCKKCLTEEDCSGRASCEENTPEMIKHAMVTALWESPKTVRYFVEEIGFDVNTPLDEYQSTALHKSASYGGPQDLENIRYLVSKGANINAVDALHRTPLLTAIWEKNNTHARFLISQRAALDIRGRDACLSAYRWSNLDIIPDLPGCCARLQDNNLPSCATAQ